MGRAATEALRLNPHFVVKFLGVGRFFGSVKFSTSQAPTSRERVVAGRFIGGSPILLKWDRWDDHRPYTC